MPARTCTSCERTWKERGARYCGVCGAPLRATPEDPSQARLRRIAAVAGRVASAGVLVATLAYLATSDLTREGAAGTVALDEPDVALPTPEGSSDAVPEAASGEQRLACQPAGCQRWRQERAGLGNGWGAALLGEDRLVVLGRSQPTDHEASGRIGPSLVSLDARTGEVVREQRLPRESQGARIVDGPDGRPLLVAGATIQLLEHDGSAQWTATVETAPDQRVQIQAVGVYEDVVVVVAWHVGPGPYEELRAFDAATGQQRWSRPVGSTAALDSDVIALIDADRQLIGVEPDTGQDRWVRSTAEVEDVVLGGPWLIAQEPEQFRLVHRGHGGHVGSFDGHLLTGPMPVGDRWMAIVRDLRASGNAVRWWEQDVGQLRAVVFEPGGDVARELPLGMVRGWQGCCPIHRRADGVVAIIDPGRVHEWDPGSGELVRVAPNVVEELDDLRPPPALVGSDVRSPVPGVEIATFRDGRRIEITTPDGRAVVTGDRPLLLESFDPIVVSDGRQLIVVDPVS